MDKILYLFGIHSYSSWYPTFSNKLKREYRPTIVNKTCKVCGKNKSRGLDGISH